MRSPSPTRWRLLFGKTVNDKDAMSMALAMARQVAECGNVPVGAILVVAGEVVARAGNLRETLQDPTAHAEVLALRDASQRQGRWRLDDATLYCTLEPCLMCAGALLQARVKRIVYAATEPKTGAHVSAHRVFDGSDIEVVQDLDRAMESSALLGEFFAELRTR